MHQVTLPNLTSSVARTVQAKIMSTLQQQPTAHQILRNACTVRRSSHSVAQKSSSLERDKAPRCAWHPSRVHTGLALLHDVQVQTRPWRRPVLADSRCGSRASRKVWLLLTQRLIEVQQMFENITQGMCRHEPSRTGGQTIAFCEHRR